MILRRALFTVLLAAAFGAGAWYGRSSYPRALPAAAVPSDGSVRVVDYEIAPGVTGLDVRIVAAADGQPVKECVRIPGEKGRDGGGAAGDGLFCGGAVAILPGRAGAIPQARP